MKISTPTGSPTGWGWLVSFVAKEWGGMGREFADAREGGAEGVL